MSKDNNGFYAISGESKPKIVGSIPDAPPDPSIASTRTFPDVINEFTQELLEVNRLAMGTEAILLVTRLGLLGQRLIYEANRIGMRDAADMAKRRLTNELR
jgi:hypothetical protein